ncbi:MAG: heavy metal translocating P-type ATPase, partial [Pseudomonadota bacterium]
METTALPKEQTDSDEIASSLARNTQSLQETFAPFAKSNEDGTTSITIFVTGIHCASCIQLIENGLSGQEDVISARVNMSTSRLVIHWQGDMTRADTLAAIVQNLGYGVSPLDDSQNGRGTIAPETKLLRCIAVSGFAMGNLMMISIGLWSTDGLTMGMATQDLFYLLSALIAIPAVAYAGRPFFASAYTVLRAGHTNMDVPISLAVILATAMSIHEAVYQGEHVYFDSAVMLLFFLLIGRYLDARAKGKARESARDLLSLLHGTATVIANGKQTTIPIRDVREGMKLLVAVGENIPADSTVIKGTSDLDMSLITGETLPQTVRKGDHVYAGTINLSAPLTLVVARASDDSLLSDIVKLMEKAEQGQARYVRLADKAAKLYTPVVHLLGLVTFLVWWRVVGLAWQPSLLIAITVLIITCPCALGLAVPVVQVLASGRLMQGRVLLKSGDALERLAVIDCAVFDKTGTL